MNKSFDEIWVPIRKIGIRKYRYYDINNGVDKIMNTIKSCENNTHMECVFNMINNFHNIHQSIELTNLLFEYAFDKNKKLNI